MMAKEKKKRFKLWQKIVMIIAVLAMLTGVGFLLFPPVSNEIGKAQANAAAETFDKTVEENVEESVTFTPQKKDGVNSATVEIKSVEEARKYGYVDSEGYPVNSHGKRIVYKLDLDRLHRDSLEYNKSIINNQGTVETVKYEKSALNLYEYGVSDGIYGYVSAPDIGLKLPIYLGASEQMMSYGAGQMMGTSLPLDEKNTNCALAGHTNYVGRIFFDNLKYLNVGDEVNVTNFWEKMYYKVIDKRIIDPTYTDDLIIEPDRQLLTLITCIFDNDGKPARYVVVCEKQ